MPRIGDRVNMKEAKQGAPPVVLAVQPTAYVVIETPEELKAWHDDVRKLYGLNLSNVSGSASESCSAGCSDDCDMI